MLPQILHITEIVAVAATCFSLVYWAVCLCSAASYFHDRKVELSHHRTDFLPPLSILKPLKGIDPEIYECLRSHCLQDYPDYEVLLGVSDPHDPSISHVEQLQREFPRLSIRLLICRQILGANVKVSNLAQMLPEAKYEHLLVNDSDIRVQPGYLQSVVAPLAAADIGLVTCLYRGVAGSTLGARLESLGIGTDFSAGVLTAWRFEGIRFGLGSTLAFRKRDLQAVGGFSALAGYLADDYQLGRRIADSGLKVKLSSMVVETLLPRYSLTGFFRHQIRWARAVRDSRFWGYAGLGLTFGLVWAVAGLILARGAAWAWWLLIAALILRVAVALAVGRCVLQDRQIFPLLPLLPLRDAVAFFIWLASFFGHTVVWRGDRFRLRNGKLTRVG